MAYKQYAKYILLVLSPNIAASRLSVTTAIFVIPVREPCVLSALLRCNIPNWPALYLCVPECAPHSSLVDPTRAEVRLHHPSEHFQHCQHHSHFKASPLKWPLQPFLSPVTFPHSCLLMLVPVLGVMSKAHEAVVKWQDTFWTVIAVAVRPQIQRELN